MAKRLYGWRPQLPDHRDVPYRKAHPEELRLIVPDVVDLSGSSAFPPIYDQGQLGSCTAHAGAAAFAFINNGYRGSRLALYYNERVLEGTVKQDAGAQIRDTAKVLQKDGLGLERSWPYDIAKFAMAPPKVEDDEAALRKVTVYSALTDGRDYRHCLAAGFPFVIGFSVYESFESDAVAATGQVPMPAKTESMLGGHAVCVVGFQKAFSKPGPLQGQSVYKVRNSWSQLWGDGGFFYIPCAYLDDPNLAGDAWTFRK